MLRFRRLASGALLMALLGVLDQAPLLAQTNLETNAGVHFNFTTPGAGNLALGGAFLALAFDASAAYTNPAGLTTITAPEALVEARHWNYTHRFTDRGRLVGEPFLGEFDDRAGLVDGQAENQVTGLSFLSYVYPHRDGSVALYRHELVSFRADFSTQGAYLDQTFIRSPRGIPGEMDARLAPLRNRMDVEITAYGAAGSYRLGKGFSLGVAVSYYDFSIDSLALRYLPLIDAAPDFASDPLLNSQTQRGDDSDWGFAAGFLWESPRKTWSLGGVYRQGPDFTFVAQSKPENLPALVSFRTTTQKAAFHVPDVYGVGLAYRPIDAFRLAFDYDRVRYSQLLRGFVDIFNLAALPPVNPQFPEPLDPELSRFAIDDTGELHLGAEYAFLRHWPVLTLRAGGWYEPDHSLRFEGNNLGFRAVFRKRDDQIHYTAGVGLALRRLQVDAAIDHSDRVSVISVSAGFRH